MAIGREQQSQHEALVCTTCAAWIAKDVGLPLNDVVQPDKLERNKKAVDLEFMLGPTRYVLEHTELEPFEKYKELGERCQAEFGQWALGIEKRLPKGGYFILDVPAQTKWWKTSRARADGTLALEDWILHEVPALYQQAVQEVKRARSPSGVSLKRSKDAAIPFDVTLYCKSWPADARRTFSVQATGTRVKLSEADIEARVSRALTAKLPKLQSAKGANSVSVMLFEYRLNAVPTSGTSFVFSQDFVIEKFPDLTRARGDAPDLAFVVNTTAANQYWLYWQLKGGDKWVDTTPEWKMHRVAWPRFHQETT
ncbi:MAG: hypothetical protein HPKKFMNG_02275 [Planctomycetes bacterium]|nr:hypothetical protein [Planctomycetota bacterium]HRJ79107.1 hypothetical protein [Planctomycetota bacterium]